MNDSAMQDKIVDIVRPLAANDLAHAPDKKTSQGASVQQILENGEVAYFPDLGFDISEAEQDFLSPRWSNGKSKNINLRPQSAQVRGAEGNSADMAALASMLERFARRSEQMVDTLLPAYSGHWRRGGTSFRPVSIADRESSWHRDDTRLHVDSFPSNPTRGQRLLRVFCNVNPNGEPRRWRLGEPFPQFARHFLPRTRAPLPGMASALHALGITKQRRSHYDHLMLQLHDSVKADGDYQRNAPQQPFAFPSGATWMVFSDQVLHAAMAGQYALETTFFIEPGALADEEKSPLRVLEKLKGRKLL